MQQRPHNGISESPGNPRKAKSSFSGFQVVVLILCALLFQRLLQEPNMGIDIGMDMGMVSSPTIVQNPPLNVLAVPEGQAPNLPSVRVVDVESNKQRREYGGEGDKPHLGGFTDIDMLGISPAVWKHMVANWTVQSVLDVGCGRGISTSWFVTHGLRTECVEGSHDAIEKSMVPDKKILTEHDFARGPWWPGKTFDLVWSVEFLEHVSLHFHYNYVSSFRKAAIIVCTSSNWGGWHHVEVHSNDWWIRKYESYGFRYDQKLTDEIREIAMYEMDIFPPNGERLKPQHIFTTAKVFINPAVAALPEHNHLFGELGCFTDYKKPNRECGKSEKKYLERAASMETPLDPSFMPLVLTEEQDQTWYDIVKANIQQPE